MMTPFQGQQIQEQSGLYGINQDVLGNRYGSSFSSTLTNYGQNQGLQIEQIVSSGPMTAAGTVQIYYDDQSKSTPPQILAFLAINGVNSTTVPYSEVLVGSVVSYFYVQAFNQYVNFVISGTPQSPTYTFTAYILAQNTLK